MQDLEDGRGRPLLCEQRFVVRQRPQKANCTAMRRANQQSPAPGSGLLCRTGQYSKHELFAGRSCRFPDGGSEAPGFKGCGRGSSTVRDETRRARRGLDVVTSWPLKLCDDGGGGPGAMQVGGEPTVSSRRTQTAISAGAPQCQAGTRREMGDRRRGGPSRRGRS